MTTVLGCTEVDAGYAKGRPCVRGFDLSLAEGEVLCLLGPNGAGKTTLLMTLAGLLPGLGGTVTIAGTSVKPGQARAASRAGLVLVPDDRSLFTGLTVEQNLELARKRSGPAVTDIVDYFPRLGERLGVTAGMLSGGEQQMLAIGRALMQKPKVLLIDELSMGLAPVIVESLLPVIRRVADDNGTAVILVEQHVRLALETADTAIVLAHGRDVLRGSATELAADPEQIERAYLGTAEAPASA
ncbi:ABC transporter ATP-binding protein [Nocardia jiangxiensis]|uniref:ABC transporter ATP-binding protein n=1 Tax=Nocardia jiangxiensis TaxID=282685 RepID=A0ABW6SAC7_9NOCA|nr:ATP-binding cassette domain-containing protein [Nocardia jiangxiensis]